MKVNNPLLTEATLQKQREKPVSFTSGRLSSRQILVGILLLATVLRVASSMLHGDAVVALPGIYDQISYDGLARRVMEGYGFSFALEWWPMTRAGEPTAHWSYLYTLYITAVYVLFGAQPLVARLIQAVIAGLLHSWLAWHIGRRIFGPAVGLIAAASSAVYLYFVYYAGALLTETFYVIGILWTLDVALRLTAGENDPASASRNPMTNWWRWLELGIAIGMTVLLRQVFILFIPFLFLWLWWNLIGSWLRTPYNRLPEEHLGYLLRESARRKYWPVLKGSIVTGLVVFILIIPWTIRNYRSFGTFVPLRNEDKIKSSSEKIDKLCEWAKSVYC